MTRPPRTATNTGQLAQPYPPPHPAFRQRKSSTIISIGAGNSDSPPPAVGPAPPTSATASARLSPTRSLSSHHEDMSEMYDDEIIDVLHESGSSTPHVSLSGSAAGVLHHVPADEATGLLTEESTRWYEGPLFAAGIKLSLLFMAFTIVVGCTFWFGLPKLDEADRGDVKLPRSFADLQALNALFQKYRQTYPYRLLACGVVSYLFVQTFSLPGSMYISILFGAAYGMINGLLLSCLCDSVGSIFCYTLSAVVAPPLLALPYYRDRVETWRAKIIGDGQSKLDIAAFLVVLRIAPFPPHWVANFVAPHLGIGALFFWATCFVGIAPVSVIHVTIGSSLDSMTSADDFHILSVRNVLGLLAVVVAVLIPVGLKRVFRKDLGGLADAEEALEATKTGADVPGGPVAIEYDESGRPLRFQAVDSGVVLAGPSAGDPNLDSAGAPTLGKGKGRSPLILGVIAEDDAATPHPVAASKVEGKARMANYGAIEPIDGQRPPPTSAPWWQFAA